MFSDIKNKSSSALTEIRKYLIEVKNNIPNPPDPPTDYDNICKGLFFVYIYGVYEATISQTVIRCIELINNSNVNISSCREELLCLILNDEYNSIKSVGANKRWEKRWEVSSKFIENGIVKINANIIPTDGKNYRHSQLKSVWTSFGVENNILPRNEIGGRIDEMVNFRNDIAHGNDSPKNIGKKFTISDLESKFNDINEYCTYIVDVFEDYIQNKKYLRT